VGGPGNVPYVTAYYKSAGPEQGNVAFFVTKIDVTEAILDQGGGVLEGDYTVSGLLADVCLGAEAICADPPNPPVCARTHTNGAGSFALLLVVRDLELPLHSIATFEGMEAFAGDSVDVTMVTANQISDPAAGSLAVYVLEGDLGISSGPGCTSPTDEFIEVDGDTSPTQDGVCLFDDDNPLGNPFNATINVQSQTGSPPCSGGINECCGDGLCPVTGVDIDRYNISSALVPGVNQVRATVASVTDRIALALVVLGVDVFEPVLSVDTQVRVLEPDGHTDVLRREENGDIVVRVGAPIVYSIAVSNTGNVTATDTSVRFVVPAQTTVSADNAILILPPDAGTPTVAETGAENGTGEILVSGFRVPAGEIAEVRVQVWANCGAAGQVVAPTIHVGSAEVPPFTVESDCTSTRGNCFEVTGAGPGENSSICPDTDPSGPFGLLPDARSLRGGGGCRSTPAISLALLLLVGALAWRRRITGFMVMALALTSCTEPRDPSAGNDPDAPPPGVRSLDGLPGEACGDALMVWVTRTDDSRFCIDRFEASLDSGDLGDAHQGSDDLELSTNGSTTAGATVVLGQPPTQGISWYQAKAACENVSKRLCTLEEWQSACRGPDALIYPYGDRISDSSCQGFFAYPDDKPSVTGSLASCLSPWGAYDLSGNVEEWTDTPVPRIPGSTELNDRAVRGGSFKSNSSALACIGDEFHEAPGSSDIDRGFRCCK